MIGILSCFIAFIALTASASESRCELGEKGQSINLPSSLLKTFTVPTNNCAPMESHGRAPLMEGKLTPFWAQEYIGADLVKEEFPPGLEKRSPVRFFLFEKVDIQRMDQNNLGEEIRGCKLRTNSPPWCVALLESIKRAPPIEDPTYRFSSYFHGTAVAQLVADPISGAAAQAELVSFQTSAKEALTDVAARSLRERAMLLCSSNNVDNTNDTIDKSLQAFYQSGGLHFSSSNNGYLNGSTNIRVANPEKKFIVSSLSPTGFVTDSSSPRDEVLIGAPSDHYVQAGHENTYVTFGGTSGAQPLACGSAANVVSLLPGITKAELETIIRETAVPTVNQRENPRKNGVGMINAYKMFRVAKRLQEGWPGNRKEIHPNSPVFNFRQEARQFAAKAEKLSCGHPCDQAHSLRMARRAYLLDPVPKYAAILEKRYRELGFEVNAKFFESLRDHSIDLVKRQALDPDSGVRNPALRMLQNFGREGAPVLNEAMTNLLKISRQTEMEAQSFVLGFKSMAEIGEIEDAAEIMIRAAEMEGSSSFFDEAFFQLSTIAINVHKQKFSDESFRRLFIEKLTRACKMKGQLVCPQIN